MPEDRCSWCDQHAPATIGEVARHVGVSVEALRYYEAMGLVAPERAASGQRRYPIRALNALHVVMTMRGAGFGVSQVQRLIAQKTSAPPQELVAGARGVLHDLLAELAERRAELDRAEALMLRWCDDLDSTGW